MDNFVKSVESLMLKKTAQSLNLPSIGIPNFEEASPEIVKISQYLLLSGGKRIRPRLTYLASQFGDIESEENAAIVKNAAAAVEFVHLGSLYHDDIMDKSAKRHNLPTAHKVWGDGLAIAAGDLIFAIGAKLTSTLPSEAREVLSEAFRQICYAQMLESIGPEAIGSEMQTCDKHEICKLEIYGEEEPQDSELLIGGEHPETLKEHYISVVSGKTASLLAASAKIGAISSRASKEVCDAIYLFAFKIGIAFQIIDDILDITSPSLGKSQGIDLENGTLSLPLIFLKQHDPKLFENPDIEKIAVSPAISLSHEVANRYTQQAIYDFSMLELPENLFKARTDLIEFSKSLLIRNK